MLSPQLLSWLLLLVASVLPAVLCADEPVPASKKPPNRLQIEHLIQQLGSQEYKYREVANRQLEQIGSPAMPALRAAARGSNDAEIRRRAAGLVAAIENSLEQLLVDYRSLGLPLPPRDAPLVRYETGIQSGGGNDSNDQVEPTPDGVAFLLKQGSRGKPSTLLQGTYQSQLDWSLHIQHIKPDPQAVRDLIVGDDLALAIQCQARGWRKLAQYLLEQDRKVTRQTPHQALLQMAWNYWEEQLTEPKIGRRPIAKRLKELIGKDKELDTVTHRALLKSLDLALVPSKAKPGSIEAMIDSLVDDAANRGTLAVFEGGDDYWRLVERGFDAVPALLNHLDDDRLTRGMMQGFNNFRSWHLRVRFLVSDMLQGLAGQDLGRDWLRRQQGYEVKKADAQKWWDEARQVGEKRYLLEHVLPQGGNKDQPPQVNVHQLRVIRAKYPTELPRLYRLLLDKRPELDSAPLVDALSRSKLASNEKLALFRYGAHHKDLWHRLSALGAIKDMDPKQFDALMLATIQAFPTDVPGAYWTRPEVAIAHLATESSSPAVWQALERSAKRAAVGLRMELLGQIADAPDQHQQAERLRLLAGFLNDGASRDIGSNKKYDGPCAGFTYDHLAVQDLAALELAHLLGIKVPLKPDRTPAEWASIRHQVRVAVDKVLSKSKLTRGHGM